MPTRRKPQLTHQSAEYARISQRFHDELLARERVILERAGFYKEFGDPDDASYTGRNAASELICELAGLLATALTIRLDAGYKAPSRVIATLKAIIKNPKLALSDATEPEARGALAAVYQRENEPPGTFWFDIFEPEFGRDPEELRIGTAAGKAIADLQGESARGRPVVHDIKYLASKLRQIFLRFNDAVRRTTVWSSRGNGDLYRMEDGAFFAFVEEVLAPLRRFLAVLPNDGEVLVSELSAEYIARLAMTQGSSKSSTGAVPIYLHNFHRVERYRLAIEELREEGAQENPRLRLLRKASFWCRG